MLLSGGPRVRGTGPSHRSLTAVRTRPHASELSLARSARVPVLECGVGVGRETGLAKISTQVKLPQP